ncbi:hypothetical protein [Cryobacterium sp. MDB2-33-2]|uniref:hypothetical protein n=1 Tax=Cryobacterium sp. MDB2-33-2 TaxID=1259179 RepID=UPI001069EC59|nr:hypothetical protein [Cryobacterium sp. MDB2-33-2]TFC03371.1 hypothetical protein E3O59_15950 [Cryobacterium sp. MDB2-33-2]
MDEEDSHESHPAESVGADTETRSQLPLLIEKAPLSALPPDSAADARARVRMPRQLVFSPGIVWVRASDLLNSGSGRIAGRGIDFEAELARRMRRTPATTRRAIRERADRLPPLSEFGSVGDHPQFSRYGLGRS